MAIVTINDTYLTNIAEAIRTKSGSTDTYKPADMATAIQSIPTGGGSTGGNSGFAALMQGETNTLYDDTVTSIRSQAFAAYGTAGTMYITTVDLPNCTELKSYAFYNQQKITTVNLPKLQTLGQYALCYCTALTEVKLPEVVTVDSNAVFTNDAHATVLTKVDLGDKVTSIGAQAFRYHENLTTVIVRATTPPTLSNSNAFGGTQIGYAGTGIYVPAAAVDAYKAATNWSSYKSVIKAIEDYPDICGEVA